MSQNDLQYSLFVCKPEISYILENKMLIEILFISAPATVSVTTRTFPAFVFFAKGTLLMHIKCLLFGDNDESSNSFLDNYLENCSTYVC